ncbi:unnamed protein product [Microthlaspi erraticum]|uniref:Cystatin domain-containing protein n=1 Tax=Microthlaspi erraticum TaxID=1685480 RepID=A0A6D2IQU6_9BRAS|nr:unnamed protein product [Microthlaspi erraticum]
MNNNKAIFILLLSLVLLPLYAFAAARTDGYRPIKNIKDPHVTEIGEFAVSEYVKKTKSELKFVTVVSGEYQVVAGMNYKLVIKANHTGESNNYEAIIWEKPWLKFMNLTSFKPLEK